MEGSRASHCFNTKIRNTTFLIISSTFHLIRIGEIILTCAQSNNFKVRTFVDNFVLIGAENDLSTELPIKHLDKHTLSQ